MGEHSPLPWRFSPWHLEEGPSAVRTGQGENYIICTTASDEDAAFIVKACNAHAAIAKALDDIEALSDKCINLERYSAESALDDLQAIRRVIKLLNRPMGAVR